MGQFENPGVPPDYIGMWTGEGSDGPLTGIVTEEVGGYVGAAELACRAQRQYALC